MTRPAVLLWEDPPPDGRHAPRTFPLNHHELAEELRDNPRRWALVLRGSDANGSLVNYMRYGRLVAYRPARAFEAVYRTAAGEARIYARYVGTDGSTVDGGR